MALRAVLLKITGDPSDAKRALAETAAELRKLDGQEAQARISIKDEAVKAQIEIVKARLERLGKQEATPKVKIAMGRAVEQLDRLEAKLSDLDGKDVTVDVNVDRKGGLAGAVAGVGAAVSAGVGGLAAFVSAATAGIPPLARLVELAGGLGPALIIVVPIMAAVASSFVAAAAGAAALGVALAAALGPVVLVGIVAVTKLVQAFQAVDKQSKGAASSARQQASSAAAVANAQDSVRSATEGLAGAQRNLGEQAVAANRAWADSIEAVKDDLLGIERAQRGTEDASLNLREAQQALRDFTAESGIAGNAFADVFKKFTDVSVDTSGLQAAIKTAAGVSGTSVSGDDELKLERLIQNVRDAKTAEKEATDKLHDSNVALKRDRGVEADFARRGIEAFGPYRDALEAITRAQRTLVASRRQLAQAQKAPVLAAAAQPKAPTGPVADLVANIKHTLAEVGKAFGPALDAIFRGANRGLTEFVKSFKDPAIIKALTDIGRAIGDVFVTFGKLFANKEFRGAFVELAEGGAKLVRILGQRVFVDFATLLLRLAVAALPDLIALFTKLAGKLHSFVESTDNVEKFRQKIHNLIQSTEMWVNRIKDLIKFLVAVTRALTDVFNFGKKALKLLNELIFGDRATKIGQAIGQAMTRWLNGALKAIGGFVGDVIHKLGSIVGEAGKIGGKIGRGLVSGIKGALRGLESIGKFVANGLIDALNFAIHAINHGLPDKINLPGLPDINLPNNPIPEIPRLEAGGVALRSVLANIGERGKEAVIPLTQSVLRQLGAAISMASPQLRGGMLAPAMAGGPSVGTHIEHFHTHIDAPAGELPDVRHTATALSRLMERTTGGDVRQD